MFKYPGVIVTNRPRQRAHVIDSAVVKHLHQLKREEAPTVWVTAQETPLLENTLLAGHVAHQWENDLSPQLRRPHPASYADD